MKKRVSKLIAVLAAIMVFSGTFSVLTFLYPQAENADSLFFDDFNSYGNNASGVANKNAMIANGWDTPNNTTGNYNTGSSYCVPANTQINISTANKAGSNNWSDYSVSCKIKASDNTTGNSFAYISGRITGTSGYFLRVGFINGVLRNYQIQIFENGTKKSQFDQYNFTTSERLSAGTVFTVKLEFVGNTINGYLNDVKKVSATDTSYSKGCAGIRTASSNVTSIVFDDFSVLNDNSSPNFSDNFDDQTTMTSNGWSGNSYGTKANGKFVLSASKSIYLTGISSAKNWKDYTFEADVALLSGTVVSASSARIVAYSNNTNGNGYEFGISIDANSDKSLVLYKRGVNGGKINNVAYKKAYPSLLQGKSYKLRITVKDKRIVCAIDDEIVFDVTDSDSLTSGYIGLRSVGESLNAEFDNVVVRKITANDTKYTFPEGYYYKDHFDQARSLKSVGWNAESGTIDENNSICTLKENTGIYLTDIEDSKNWDNYVIEGKIALIGEGCNANSIARIVGRSTATASNGYEYGISYSPDTGKVNLQLYKRGESGGKINGTAYSMTLNNGQFDYHTYKMVLSDSRIICYYDGLAVFDVTDSNPILKGYAGIRSISSSTGLNIDYFNVRKINEEDKNIEGKDYGENCYYSDGFDSIGSMTILGWSADPGKRDIEKGIYTLPENNSIYLTGIKNASDLTDYVVESRFKLNNKEATTSSSARIVARSTNKSANGYEYGITFDPINNITYLQLYKRGVSAGKINNTIYSYELQTDAFEYHDYKIVIKDSKIICFFDDNVIFDVSDKEPLLLGYPGLRTAGGSITSSPMDVDQYIVRTVFDEDLNVYNDFFEVEGYYYNDDFSISAPMTAIGWSGESGSRDTKNGLYVMKPNSFMFYNNTDYFTENNNYCVESNFAINEGITEYSVSPRLVARTENSTKSGYEFGCSIDPVNNNSSLLLYKRGASGGKINNKVNSLNIDVKPGEFHSYKMVVFGNRILCYFDGMKVFDVVDNGTTQIPSYDKGYVGIKIVANENNTIGATLDDFSIKYFEDSDIVEDKTIENISDSVWFFDDFNDETSLSERGWSSDTPSIKNGQVSVFGWLYLDGVKNSRLWNDYEVTADVYVDNESGFVNSTTGSSRICLRSLGENSGYEFGIITPSTSSPYLVLYDRKNKEYLCTDKTFEIDEGQHSLRALCSGNVIECYYDDQLVFNHTSNVFKAGYAGIRASGINTYYDNFQVTKLGYHNNQTSQSPKTSAILDITRIIAMTIFAMSLLLLVSYILYNIKKKEV